MKYNALRYIVVNKINPLKNTYLDTSNIVSWTDDVTEACFFDDYEEAKTVLKALRNLPHLAIHEVEIVIDVLGERKP